MSDDLLKWAALVEHSSQQVVAKLLHDQATQVKLLRGVCRMGSDYAYDIRGRTQPKTVVWSMLNNLASDLADAGKEPSDAM